MSQLHRSAKRCVIVDYGMGNLWSVDSAVRYLGYKSCISSNPDDLQTASHLILPGVGSFRMAMESLNERGLAEGVRDFVKKGNGFLLGICLGLQLLAASSPEDGHTEGFGFIPHLVEKFALSPRSHLPTPHIGFNSVSFSPTDQLFRRIQQGSHFYFVHSYRLSLFPTDFQCATAEYGEPFVAAVNAGQVSGTQFHPEKSQSNGLRLLYNFFSKS